jgi:hypothetical protein
MVTNTSHWRTTLRYVVSCWHYSRSHTGVPTIVTDESGHARKAGQSMAIKLAQSDHRSCHLNSSHVFEPSGKRRFVLHLLHVKRLCKGPDVNACFSGGVPAWSSGSGEIFKPRQRRLELQYGLWRDGTLQSHDMQIEGYLVDADSRPFSSSGVTRAALDWTDDGLLASALLHTGKLDAVQSTNICCDMTAK